MRLAIRPTVYIPFHSLDTHGAVQPKSRGTFVVRTSSRDPLTLAAALRSVVSQTRSGFRVDNIRTQAEIIRSRTVRERLLAMLGSFFSGVALLLAGVGLYGVLDYSVLQRQREIGIRLAIGARGGDIVRAVTVGVLSVVAAGSIAGMALGIALARYADSLLYGVRVTDPGTWALPALGILATALAAALRPMIRAIRIDAVAILRME